jgi:hypothetical protein
LRAMRSMPRSPRKSSPRSAKPSTRCRSTRLTFPQDDYQPIERRRIL